jgi:hypothetical protein
MFWKYKTTERKKKMFGDGSKDPREETLKLKQTAVDTWNVREQLTLATAVLQSGDQVIMQLNNFGSS